MHDVIKKLLRTGNMSQEDADFLDKYAKGNDVVTKRLDEAESKRDLNEVRKRVGKLLRSAKNLESFR